MNLPNETKAKLLQTISSLPPARIGFYGETGVGKSTIIDRLLGVNLLKSPAMSGGTKMIVELVPHFDTTRDDYIFDFISVSEETVKDWLKQAKSEAQHWRDQSAVHPETSGTGSASDFLKWFVTNLTNEEIPYTPFPTTTTTTDENTSQCQQTFAFESLDFSEVDLLPKYSLFLQSYGGNKGIPSYRRITKDLYQTVFEDIQQFSTFIQHVTITGPFHLLRALHITLVDIPGTNDGTWIYEERSHIAISKICTDIFYITDHRLCNPINERRLLELSRYCKNLSIIRTNCLSLIKKSPNTKGITTTTTTATAGAAATKSLRTTPLELSHKIFHEIESNTTWSNNQSIMDLIRQIAKRDGKSGNYNNDKDYCTGIYGIENMEGLDSEYDERFNDYWNYFINEMKLQYGQQRWDKRVLSCMKQINDLFTMTRSLCNSNGDTEIIQQEMNELQTIHDALNIPLQRHLSLTFIPNNADYFIHHCPGNHRTLQCWLTNTSSYWCSGNSSTTTGEWRNAYMNELIANLIHSCYPPLLQSKLFDEEIHLLIKSYLLDIKHQICDGIVMNGKVL